MKIKHTRMVIGLSMFDILVCICILTVLMAWASGFLGMDVVTRSIYHTGLFLTLLVGALAVMIGASDFGYVDRTADIWFIVGGALSMSGAVIGFLFELGVLR